MRRLLLFTLIALLAGTSTATAKKPRRARATLIVEEPRRPPGNNGATADPRASEGFAVPSLTLNTTRSSPSTPTAWRTTSCCSSPR
jgi:hypothetical protein